ncbi:MAG TPA: hypothetical protein VN031_01785 [Candidatus Microsaccharimonas sp.]|nr:hypothetical protein [Candidatus Microsaccharimonas sp.]
MKKKTTPVRKISNSRASVAKKTRKTPVLAKRTTTPKGLRHHAKRLYHLTPKFVHGMVVGAFVGIVTLVPLGKIGHTSALSIATGQDCDSFSIINCGVSSTNDLQAKYRASNYIQAVYAHMGISSSDISGMDTSAVAGTVYDDGTVKVGGKLVAKNVLTEARQRVTSGDRQVTSGGATFYVRSLASSWSHHSAPAYVVMKNNVFQFAILAPCGNSVTGTPTTSPPPPPPVPNITVCYLATKHMVTIKETAFDSTKYSKNPADCQIKVCDLTKLQIITIQNDAFNSKTESKNLAACTPPPGTMTVCNLTTKAMVTIKDNTFNSTKYSKNPADCEQPTPVAVQAAATSLPNTGPGAILIVFGAAILGGYIFHIRHRHTQHKKRAVHHAR